MEILFNTLYARDHNRNIKQWKVTVVECDGYSIIETEEGLKEGKKSKTSTIVSKGKNIGKKNETNHLSQAQSEAESKYNKKEREGYKSLLTLGITDTSSLDMVLPVFNTDADNQLKPMKCQQYLKDNGQPRISFPCLGQPKINGFRCILRLETKTEGLFKEEHPVFRSKNGLEYDILRHITIHFNEEDFIFTGKINDIQYNNLNLVFDGELYIDGYSLQDISSAVRKPNEDTIKLQYHIFDLAVDEIVQVDRTAILKEISTKFTNKNYPIRFVESRVISSHEEAVSFTDSNIYDGHEGSVFRDMKATYQFGLRPSTMVKLKKVTEGDFVILDVVLSDKNDPRYAVLVCQNDTNLETFKCAIEGSTSYRTEVYENKANYIGKIANIAYYERTKKDIPFHTTCLVIKDFE